MKAYLCLLTVLGIGFFGILSVAADFPRAWQESRLTQALHAQQQAVSERESARQQIVEDVIAEKLTFAQAVEKFSKLEAYNTKTLKAIRLTLAVDSQQECLCCQVMMHIKVALEGKTSADTILPRLESEWNDYIGEHYRRI